jgi:putative tricarboxylic transport membrane protein
VSGRAADAAASVFLLLLGTATCAGAWRLGLGDVHAPGPGFMPFAAAALLAAMAAVQLVRAAATARAAAAPAPFAGSRWGTLAIVLAALAGFGAVIGPLGFAVSTFLMLFVLFRLVARKGWWTALAAALLIAAAARVGFRALGLELPTGPLRI